VKVFSGKLRAARARGGSDTRARDNPQNFRWRANLVFALLVCGALGLVWRAVELQLKDHKFLAGQGDARFSRVAEITATRGTITDRYGEPLAVSTPVDSVWVNPKELALASDQLPRLAKELKRDKTELARRVTSNLDREFLYLARHMQPAEAQKIRQLEIPGVYLMREYRRYYPAGEVAGHIIGFTSVDDEGQEGLELAFDHWLAGEDGAKRVIQDRYGKIVQNVEEIRAMRPGRNLVLSIDLRIQYLAYRELKAAIRDQRAKSGSVIVLDVATGEVLAMVNQPTYNPNDRDQINAKAYRNRAVTDIVEPGSSMKPFFVAAGLASGRFDDHSIIDTSPGYIKVGAKLLEDPRNLGAIDLATILAKSSNVGMTKVALSLEPAQMYDTLTKLGFGQVTTSGYPGESAGLLPHYSHWRPVGISSMSRGYGLSITPLQLAHAYATVASYGVARPISFLRVESPPEGQKALDPAVARTLIHLLESVVSPDGGGKQAAIPGYTVAGKTGTAWKATAGGYATDRYLAVFGGVAPASNPRLAAIVVIDEPGAGKYYGGEVAAPVFSGVVGGALRLLAVPPDAPVGESGPGLGVTRTVATR
jgi:cell division protein FtsI (penicillin-binding protein 3)